MKDVVFSRRTKLPVSAARAFAWHERPGAFARLSPPWEVVRIVDRRGGLEEGGRVTLETRIGPLRQAWVAEHFDYDPPRQFRDRQLSGPFARWDHRHLFHSEADGGCTLEDRIEYALPLGALGALFGGSFVRRKLERLFAWRHRVTRDDLALLAGGPETTMRIAVTGASGLIGSALSDLLTTAGHSITKISLRQAALPDLSGFDAVIHLAGENIAGGRWTAERKARIVESRVNLTRRLAEALAALPAERRPQTLLCASAIGFYGDRGDETLTEASRAGHGFLPETCQAWEGATQAAEAAGIRVVHLRFGVVLSPLGGVLERLLPPFRLGLGGPVGSGRQWFSWVALDDVVGAIHHALTTPTLSGPVNVTAPEPVPNAAFGALLGRILGRPALLPLPAFAIRLAFGEMGQDLLLGSQRVLPERLEASGYRFRFRILESALRHLLGRTTPESNAPAMERSGPR